jgi:hypothetical protein
VVNRSGTQNPDVGNVCFGGGCPIIILFTECFGSVIEGFGWVRKHGPRNRVDICILGISLIRLNNHSRTMC